MDDDEAFYMMFLFDTRQIDFDVMVYSLTNNFCYEMETTSECEELSSDISSYHGETFGSSNDLPNFSETRTFDQHVDQQVQIITSNVDETESTGPQNYYFDDAKGFIYDDKHGRSGRGKLYLTDDRKHICPCGKRYRYKGDLKYHVEKKHPTHVNDPKYIFGRPKSTRDNKPYGCPNESCQ